MKKHWSVLIYCCGLAAASIGISINSSGVFYTPVSKSLHILRGTNNDMMAVAREKSVICIENVPLNIW